MESIGTLIFIILFGAIVWWRQNSDRKRNGTPTKQDRYKTTVIAVVSCFISFGIAYWGSAQYTLASLVILLFYQLVGVGVGKRGWYRQIKDGLFLGWVLGLPFSLIWLVNYANT